MFCLKLFKKGLRISIKKKVQKAETADLNCAQNRFPDEIINRYFQM